MLRRVLPALLLLVACDASTEPDGTEPDIDDPSAELTTWHADIAPLMNQNCTRCHQEGGPSFDFTNYDTVVPFAEIMLQRMDAGLMPPPAADPECRDYIGSEHMHLTDEGRDLFAKWIEDGTPEGDPADAPGPIEQPPLRLEDPDLELIIPEPYLPEFTSERNPGNAYRCFYLEHGQDEDFFITAQHPIVDQASLLHHAVLLKAPKSRIPQNYDPAVGVDCIDNTMVGFDNMVGGWAPGMEPLTYADGHGLRIQKDEVLVLQFHYYYPGPAADGLRDRSGYALNIASEVDLELPMLPLGLFNFRSPAGAERHTESGTLKDLLGTTLPIPITVHGVFPHMHQLGWSYRSWYIRGQDETCLIESEKWDFNNQLFYQFREPLVLNPGDDLGVECVWNNSTSNPYRPLEVPQDTGYGERTDEEMCFMFTLIDKLPF